jgi:DNA invertase Pin-like site-specific DNA recombinase
MKTAEERAQARTLQARDVAQAAAASVPPTFTPEQTQALERLQALRDARKRIAENRSSVAKFSRGIVQQAHAIGIGPSMIADLTGISRTTIHKWIGESVD